LTVTPTEDRPVSPGDLEKSPVSTLGPAAKRRRGRERFFCLIGIVFGLLGIVTGRLADLWVHFDVFSHFALHFRILVAACLIGFLMPRGRTIAATVLFVSGVLALGIWPQVVSAVPATYPVAATGERAIRLMSFNTLFPNADVDAIGAEIERQDPDVVALLEFGTNKRPLFDRLHARLPYQADCLDKDFCNLVIFSKLPIASSEARVSWEGPPYMHVKFGPEAGNLNLIAVHTIRFPHQRAQYTQISALMNFLETIQGNRVMVGDFNATPFSLMVRSIERRSGLVRLTWLPSWPARFGLPQLAIDQIFVSPNIDTLEPERIGRNAGSDHYPIILAIGVPLT
jgi:endonuclease/exonuclease/phosphatase (EEP) superfamily protein YafD